MNCSSSWSFTSQNKTKQKTKQKQNKAKQNKKLSAHFPAVGDKT
jgi:hypothetical protein